MYVLVHHHIRNPEQFWSTAQAALGQLGDLKLHHTFASEDGTMATCLWEADSVSAVRDFLEPHVGAVSTNEYAATTNREGVTPPSRFAASTGVS